MSRTQKILDIPSDEDSGPAAASVPVRQRSRARQFMDKRYRAVLGTLGVVFSLAAWQLVSSSGLVDPQFASSPLRVCRALADYTTSGEIWTDLAVSGHEFVVGFGLSILVGIPLGLVMGWYDRVEAFFDPLVTFLYATPRISLIPLLVVWFGLGTTSKIVLVFLSSVFPILISTLRGVKEVDQNLVKAARSFGAGDLSIFRTVVLPASVPSIVTGLRLAVAHGLIAVVVGEFFSATAGVGYAITRASTTFHTDMVFAGVVIVAFFGVVLTAIFTRIEKHFQSWKPQRTR
jgi:ABC-type nitrate/sulfonate/bicarbonate transport system permease component